MLGMVRFAIRDSVPLSSDFTGKALQSSCESPAMLACDAKNRHVFGYRAMQNACDFDFCCGLACDASAGDAESLAMLPERCEPLSQGCADNWRGKFPTLFCNIFPTVCFTCKVFDIQSVRNAVSDNAEAF